MVAYKDFADGDAIHLPDAFSKHTFNLINNNLGLITFDVSKIGDYDICVSIAIDGWGSFSNYSQKGYVIHDLKDIKEFSEFYFQVGDTVEITKSDINWINAMDCFIGRQVEIREVYINIPTNKIQIRFEDDTDDYYHWRFQDKHFKKVIVKQFSDSDIFKSLQILL